MNDCSASPLDSDLCSAPAGGLFSAPNPFEFFFHLSSLRWLHLQGTDALINQLALIIAPASVEQRDEEQASQSQSQRVWVQLSVPASSTSAALIIHKAAAAITSLLFRPTTTSNTSASNPVAATASTGNCSSSRPPPQFPSPCPDSRARSAPSTPVRALLLPNLCALDVAVLLPPERMRGRQKRARLARPPNPFGLGKCWES